MPYPFVEHLKGHLAQATFRDASEMVDGVKVVKSDEEIDAIARTARMQDGAMNALLDAVGVGVRESDLTATVADFCQRAGSDAGVIMIGSGPRGESPRIGPRRLQNRVLAANDSLVVLIERNGAEGYFTELGRTIVLGTATDEMHEEHAFAVKAQDLSANLLKPGTSSDQIFETYNEFMREHNRPEEKRLHCHGQGYDIVERPLIRGDETMAVSARMNFAVHPDYSMNGSSYWICDNWIIGPAGVGERVHQTPRILLEC